MEWILFVIIIGVVIAIIALPIWLMLNVNLFLGIGVICLYDFIIYKCCDVPAISVILSFVLRIGLYLLLIAIILLGTSFIIVNYFNISLESLPDLFNYISVILKMIKYYVS